MSGLVLAKGEAPPDTMEPFDPAYIARGDRTDRPDAQPYDFAQPRGFSARERRQADVTHDALADSLARELSERLGEVVRVECGATDSVTGADFEQSRASPAALFELRLGEGGPALAVDLAPALALLLVERHLGGSDPLGEPRALSDLERAVVEREWLPVLTTAFAEAWATVPPRAQRFESDASLLALVPPAAPVAVADLTVTLGEDSATIGLCYPAPTFLGLIDPASEPLPASADRAVSPQALGGLPLGLRAELGRARLSVGDILRLMPGDVIPLSSAPDSPIPVQVGESVRFEARAGTRGARLALHLLTPPVRIDS